MWNYPQQKITIEYLQKQCDFKEKTMKNLKKYLLGLALITTFTLTSCNNDASKDTPSNEVSSEAENPQTTNVEITICLLYTSPSPRD